MSVTVDPETEPFKPEGADTALAAFVTVSARRSSGRAGERHRAGGPEAVSATHDQATAPLAKDVTEILAHPLSAGANGDGAAGSRPRELSDGPLHAPPKIPTRHAMSADARRRHARGLFEA